MEIVLGLFLFAFLAVLGLIALFFALHPFAGIVQCLTDPDKGGAEKGVWILFMIFFWTIGSIIYGLIGTRGWFGALTKVTMIVGLFAVIGTVGLVLLVPAARDRLPTPILDRLEQRARAPETIVSAPLIDSSAVELEPFWAVHHGAPDQIRVGGGIARFDERGLLPETLLPVTVPSYPVQKIAVDERGPVFYALTTHKFGKVVPSTGVFVEIEVEPPLGPLSWPSAIAYDAERDVVMIASRSGGLTYDPRTGDWERVPVVGELDLRALCWSESRNLFYGATGQPGGVDIAEIVELSATGAAIRTIRLEQPIRGLRGASAGSFQMNCRSDRIVILSNAHPEGSRAPGSQVHVVDPSSGAVRLVVTDQARQEG